MFQVKKIEHANKTFRLPCDLLDELEKLAQEKDVSLNQLVIQCSHYALDHLDRSEQPPHN